MHCIMLYLFWSHVFYIYEFIHNIVFYVSSQKTLTFQVSDLGMFVPYARHCCVHRTCFFFISGSKDMCTVYIHTITIWIYVHIYILYLILYYMILYYNIWFFGITSYCILQYGFILYDITLHDIILCFITLYHIMLYHRILYYVSF